MPRATLTVAVPDGTWMHDVSTTHPETVFHVVAVLTTGEVGVALVELRSPNPVPILAAMDRHGDVRELELLWKHDDRAMVQVESTTTPLLDPITRAGVPLETPFDVGDGEVEWQLTTSADRLSALGRRLDEAGVRFDLDAVHDSPVRGGDRLTERQRQLLLAAVDLGYYETPRRATLTEVAASMGIAKATGSDILHRVEGKLVDWFLAEHPSLGRREPATAESSDG